MDAQAQTETKLSIIPGPNWTEACGHGGYIASYEVQDYWYDLYVFEGVHGQSVCIRYGNDAPEYHSFPKLLYLYINTTSVVYERAVQILNHYGQLRWTKKK